MKLELFVVFVLLIFVAIILNLRASPEQRRHVVFAEMREERLFDKSTGQIVMNKVVPT